MVERRFVDFAVLQKLKRMYLVYLNKDTHTPASNDHLCHQSSVTSRKCGGSAFYL